MAGPESAKFRQLALLWGLSLGLSAALVAAGRRWPDPLTPQALSVWCLLLLPPLGTAFWLLRSWRLPPNGEGGESEAFMREQQR